MKHPLTASICRVIYFSNQYKHSILFSLLSLGSFALSANEIADPENNADIAEFSALQVTAAPILQSQTQSIEIQREAINVVSAIASDAIGQFPDQTAAGALARLPAVAVQRDQGQERYIQIRGAPARWTSVAFDNINVVGADERVFRFDSVPANVIDVVSVSKTLTPAMPAEALSGRVNIETVSPMATRGLNVQGTLGYGPMQLGEGNQEKRDMRVSWSNETFGALLGVSQYAREQTTDNREYKYNEDNIPTMFDLRSYLLKRETNSALGKLEWRPVAGHQITLSSLYTEFKDHELRNQYIINADKALAGNAGEMQGELIGASVSGMLQDGNYSNSTWVNTLAGKHSFDQWEFNWDINYTETESTFYLPIIRQEQTNPNQFLSVDYHRQNRQQPSFNLYKTNVGANGITKGSAISALNQTGFGMDLLIPYGGDTLSDSTTIKADVRRQLNFGDSSQLHFGFQSDRRKVDGRNTSGSAIPVSALASAAGVDWDSSAPYITSKLWDSDFARGFDIFYVDNKKLREQLDSTLNQLEQKGLYSPEKNYTPSGLYKVQENITAAYSMLEFEIGKHQILTGIRFERAETQSDGFIQNGNEILPTSVKSTENNLFPSFHYNINLTDNLKWRNALITGLSRPSFAQLSASATISDADQVVSGGNPLLKPETARGLDSSLEWYFADASLASVGFFYRDVSDVLFSSTRKITDNRFDGGGVSRQGYQYQTTLNGGDGELHGFELNYQQPFTFLPGFLNGLGWQINYANIRGNFKTPEGRRVGFPGTSEQIVNTSLFYEKNKISMRLAYQWRDKWLDDISPDGTEDVYWAATKQLDFSARYHVNPYLTLFADINNITDENGVRYQNNPNLPIEVEGYGRRMMFGMQVQFK